MSAYYLPYLSIAKTRNWEPQFHYYILDTVKAAKILNAWEYETHTYSVGYGEYETDVDYDPTIRPEYEAVLKRLADKHIYEEDANHMWLLKEAQRFTSALKPMCVHCHASRLAAPADPDHLQCEMRAIEALGWKTVRNW